MVDGREFLIPGVIYGNIFIGLQPSRGIHEHNDKAYHDKSLPPHHQYTAFYKWIHDEFRADAIVHVGTHGTLEFLRGKETAMSGDCWPDKLIGELPHIYLYYCGNPAEAMIAKRRAWANIVSYQPPVFTESELYGDWVELETEIENYRHLLSVSPAGADDALARAYEKAKALGLPEDVDAIEGELYRMKHSLVPHGLHVFGKPYNENELCEYARGLAAMRANGEIVSDELYKKALSDTSGASECHELEGLVRALHSGYSSPRLAGDIYRNPEVLPSGYNIYQFDPRLVPSATAMARGREIAENTLAMYRAENGSYPHMTAVILWGLETSRTQGETVGQILSYLGVRISPDSHIWDKRFEIIPAGELGRPRVDVTINICGFFRDMFGSLIELIDDLLARICELEESDEVNYIKANSAVRYKKLIGDGYSEDDALRLSRARFFGPREGEYGTGLTGIIETKNWREESQLGEAFTASLRYVYGRKYSGRDVPGLYEENLSCVEVISQLRSSHEYELTDLDHYYEFFGGLAKSVELARGKKPAMLISDTAGSRIYTETADKSIARGLRTRALNPKWIDGMLAHKYHGAQKIADRFENVMGLAATTGAVDEELYSELEKCYVADEALRRRMAENNPHAYLKILEQLMEYSSRGYWKASDEQLNRIKRAYLELEDSLEAQN